MSMSTESEACERIGAGSKTGAEAGAGAKAEAGTDSRARADVAAGTRAGTGGAPQRRCVRPGWEAGFESETCT
jgi:hypothetical protein